jgi:hypothetical protein
MHPVVIMAHKKSDAINKAVQALEDAGLEVVVLNSEKSKLIDFLGALAGLDPAELEDKGGEENLDTPPADNADDTPPADDVTTTEDTPSDDLDDEGKPKKKKKGPDVQDEPSDLEETLKIEDQLYKIKLVQELTEPRVTLLPSNIGCESDRAVISINEKLTLVSLCGGSEPIIELTSEMLKTLRG